MTATGLANTITLAWGWRRAAIALIAGAVSVLALPPLDWWPVPFLTFPLLVWLIDGAGAGRLGGIVSAAITGWLFGFGYFVAGLYWIGYAFLVDAKTFAWLLPFAVAGLPAYLALYTGLGLAIARALWLPGPWRILSLAVGLAIAEWLRGHLLTGFPWNAFGYLLAGPASLAQATSVIGLWGLTLVAVAVYASPATLFDQPRSPWRWLPAGLAAATLMATAVFGVTRLGVTPINYVDGMQLRIMQPNLPQNDKFNYSAKGRIMADYLALSKRASAQHPNGLDGVTHLIWPESAFPFFLVREPDALAQIASLLPPGTSLITGGVRPISTVPRGPDRRAYNSIYVIDHDGTVLGVYDKLHLVPFGEFLPFQNVLERIGLRQLTKVHGGFVAGDRRRTMTAPAAPRFLPLICYEAVFPGEAVPDGERPAWLLNLTNDGWFGISSGPYQHLQQARLLAIGQGLPLVRAANTGISAVIDPLGRVVASLPLGAKGVLDGRLPQPIAPTIHARLGDLPFIVMVLVALVLVLVRRRYAG